MNAVTTTSSAFCYQDLLNRLGKLFLLLFRDSIDPEKRLVIDLSNCVFQTACRFQTLFKADLMDTEDLPLLSDFQQAVLVNS